MPAWLICIENMYVNAVTNVNTQCTEIKPLYCLQSYHRTRTTGFSSLTRQTGRFLSKPTKFSFVPQEEFPDAGWLICIENMYVNAQVRIWSGVDINNDLCCTSLEIAEVWLILLTIFNIIISIQHNAYVHT
jgi:hypothetical protein